MTNEPHTAGEGTHRLLVVEDDESVRAMLVDALEFAGYAVTTERTGPDGLATARSAQPDLLVLDVNLPDQDGFSVVHSCAPRGLGHP